MELTYNKLVGTKVRGTMYTFVDRLRKKMMDEFQAAVKWSKESCFIKRIKWIESSDEV
jgi:hypothetical protein